MPAQQNTDERRGRPLLSVLFWVGVGLAPIAALMLLLSEGNGPLRIAAVLAVLAVVLIGLSITLRGNAETARLEVEETLLGEIDGLRAEFRNDIGAAARSTHRSLGEHLQRLQDNLEALRGQLESARAELAHGGPARVGATGFPHRPDSGGYDSGGYDPGGYDPGHEPAAGTGAGGRAYTGPAGPPVGLAPHGMSQGIPGGHQQVVGNAVQHVGGRATMPAGGAMQHVPGGVVRHTETVQVTTRQTIVDPHADASGPGTAYAGSVYGGRGGAIDGDWSEQAARGRRSAEYDGDSWTDQRVRNQRGGDGRRSGPYDRGDLGAAELDAGQDERWSDLRAGDRWASVRSDERGREVRMGERRAAVRADETGTEMRIEDRWASVRREESRHEESRHEESRRENGSRTAGHRDEDGWSDDGGWRDARGRGGTEKPGDGRDWDNRSWDDRGWEQRASLPALPAGGAEPAGSWGQGWSEPAPEREPARRGRRYRDDDQEFGYPPEDDVPRAGGARRMDFELSDDRWR